MGSLEGTVALVTGGARGMGASHVRGLAESGGRVIVADVLDEEGKALADELGDDVVYIHLDVTDEQQWRAAVDVAESRFGPVGALVNNAGIATWGSIEEMSLAEWQRTIDVNLTGVWLGMHTVIPSMKRGGGGAIVNISSAAGLRGYANIGAYAASKWGVRGLTKSAALELGRAGIRVNSIHPGPIRTPMLASVDGEHWGRVNPIPRLGEPEEVTKMVLFILSEATYSTGCEFIIDGGATIGQPLRPPED